MSFLDELKRRNVFRVAAAYVVVAWLVIQVVETILPAFGFGDSVVRIVTIGFVIGIVPVLVVSWVFELTPDGIRLDRDVEYDPAGSRRASKRLDRIILVVLAAALGYFAFERFVLVPERTAREIEAAREAGRSEALVESYGSQSIAVLAFEDMSADGDQAYLAEGIAEEILNLLAQIRDLRVISRSSAFSYKDKEIPIPIIAEQLNVAHILEGSVRKSGNRIRVTAQLIDAHSDTHIWSESYERELGDIFAVQDEVAEALVEELQITLMGPVPQADPLNPKAYDLFLQAKYQEDVQLGVGAVELYERVVELAPYFAEGWAQLSQAYISTAPSVGLATGKAKDPVWQQAMAARRKVADLNPDHPFLLTTAAWEAIEYEGDYVAAARLFERALKLHPQKEEVLGASSEFAKMIRRDDIAIALLQIMVGRDPLCSRCAYSYARALMRAGRYEEAEQAILRYKNVLPGTGGELTLGTIRLLEGDFEGAEEAFSEREDEIGRRFGKLLLRAARGENGTLLDDIAEFSEQDPHLGPVAIVQLFATASDVESAFRLLAMSTKDVPNWKMASLTADIRFENLHSDPRWLALEERAGVAPHQLAEIRFNPRLPYVDWNTE